MSAPSATQATWHGPLPTRQRQRRGVLVPVVGLVALGMCALLFIGLVSDSVGGVGGVVVGTLCALLPVGPLVATFLWLDRWEPEPPRLLLLAFAWGAGVAALTALLINTGAVLIAEQVIGRGSGDVLGPVVVAPIVEEAVKGVFLVGLLVLRRREFDGVVDGVVYAGLVAAGFAFTENILYFGQAFTADAMSGANMAVLATLLLRGVLSPFAHPLFTAMIGIACGIASLRRGGTVQVVLIAVGYAGAVLLHALWNGSASLVGGTAFYGVYGFIMVPLFLALIVLVLWQRRREQRIVAEQLPGFAQAGWIAPSEIPLLSSLAGRRGWQRAVRRRSGKKVAKAVVEYQAAVTELAYLRAKAARGAVPEVAGPLWHAQALTELRRARERAVGHPEALTVALRHHGPVGGWTPPAPGAPAPRTPHGSHPPAGPPPYAAGRSSGFPPPGAPVGGPPPRSR
jgi:RsiW-degrading membrane proteinase PrsW (M82 family)